MAALVSRAAWTASFVLLACMATACRLDRNRTAPSIEFSKVPRANEGGRDQVELVAGRVYGARPGQRIVLFAHAGLWYVQPFVDRPYTAIQPNSKWRNWTHLGTQYAALLVDPNYQPPVNTVALPSTGNGVIAVAMVNGRPEFWQTWWFLLTATLTSAAIVAAYFVQRIVLLRSQEQRLREVIDTMPAMAFLTRPDGHCTFVNKGWIEFTGLTAEQMAGPDWRTVVHPHDVHQVINKWREALHSGRILEHETRIRRAADGAYRWFLMRAVPLRDKNGKILKWSGAATDIEDRKQAEQLRAELTHVNRVSTMGELVASIAHEILQPISASTLNGQVALRCLQGEPPNVAKAGEIASAIVRDGHRAAEIIDRLRLLYKKAPSQRELVAVNGVVSEMVEMLRGEAREHGISLRTDLNDDLPLTWADRVQLQQILMNLMLNAIEAMADTGGVLLVKSQWDGIRVIEISVSDTGPGLPPGKADQLFEAFFTTKARGSGMGLSISKSIVEAHGGRIWARGNDGRGATFYFTLPWAAEVADHPESLV